MKGWHITRRELAYQVRSVQWASVVVVLFGFTFLLTANAAEFQESSGVGTMAANAPYRIVLVLISVGIFATLIVPAFMANAVLRDRACGFDEILLTTPLRKSDYLLGRFTGALLALIAALGAAPLGLWLGTYWPWADPETVISTPLYEYLIAFFLILTPTIIVTATIIFAIATLTLHTMSAYVAAIGLLMLYLIGGETNVIPPILDPFAFEWFEEYTRYWTTAERNAGTIHYEWGLLVNRLLWLTGAGCLWVMAYWRFSLQTHRRRPKKAVQFREGVERSKPLTEGPAISYSQQLPVVPTWGTALIQWWTRVRFETRTLVMSWPFLILLGFSLLLLLFGLLEREVMYGVNAYPLTRIMIHDITATLSLVLLAVLIVYSSEIMWRERACNISELIDATPVSNGVLVASKITAMLILLASIVVAGMVIAVGVQVAEGYDRVEWTRYLQHGLVYFLIQFFCLAVLACFCHVLVANRFLGMLLMAGFLALSIVGIDWFGVEHPLLKFGLGGMGAGLSDMNGSGRFVTAGHWLRVYWLSIAGLLLVALYLLWPRGTLQPLALRLRALRQVKRARWAMLIGLLLATFGLTAAVIFYNTNILNEYLTRADIERLRVAYERKYRAYEHLPMPRIVDVRLDVDLYPDQGRVEARGRYLLQNKTEQELSSVHVVFPSQTQVVAVDLEEATQAFYDETYRYYGFDLAKPMKPGEQLALTFATSIQQRGFVHDRPDTRLVRNGTFLRGKHLSPFIGFQPDYLIRDPKIRDRYGLESLPPMPDLNDETQFATNDDRGDSDLVSFETTVSTIAGQTAVSVGRLVEDWREGDRHFFTYRLDQPARYFVAFLSAEYATAVRELGNLRAEIYYHPTHDYNLERMFAAIRDSVTTFERAFQPYQFDQVRIVEFPAYRSFAQSFPMTIPYSESMGFVAQVKPDDIDMPYYVTAHEVAHQWWGFQVTAANTQGASFIHESLAQYSALLVMEQTYGSHHIRPFLKYELDSYLAGRGADPLGERPLYRVEDQDYIYYRKGSLTMYALRDYLGAELVNRVLRRLLARRAYSSDPYTRSSDFLKLLREEAGPEWEGLIRDFFERITLFDLAIEDAQVEPLADGRFQVTLRLETAKAYADKHGHEQRTPMDLPVDIGLFLADPANPSFGAEDVIHLEKHYLEADTSTLVVVVDRAPLFAGIDPYHKLIDRQLDDNLIQTTPKNPEK